MTIWFTSDTHYGHSNIIKPSYSNRPFKDVTEMDEAMIENWNTFVQDEDEVYHLGDIAYADVKRFKEIFYHLKGRKKVLKGNHDKEFFKHEPRTFGVEWVENLHEIKVPDKDAYDGKAQMIVLCHYSMRVWNKSHFGSWNLYGHSHGSLEDPPTLLSMDVGVDAVARRFSPFPAEYVEGRKVQKTLPYDYRPISYAEVKAHMKTKEWEPVDHHTRDGTKRSPT